MKKIDYKKNPKDRTSTMLMMLVSIFVLTLTVGYAALNKEVKISSEGTFKVVQDIRITDLRIDEVKNTALENYENDYAKDSIKVGVTLPNINSSISYKVEVTNTGTVAQWIDSIDDLVNNNSDMEYTLEGITTRQLIYPGEVKEFDIKIKYKEGITITNDTIDLLIKLNFVQPVSILAQGNSGTTTFFNTSPINKTEIESIEFLPTLDVGENAIGSWDASYEKNGTVIAWYTDTDSNNLYELYIGGVGEVQTPVNASALFSNFTKVTSIDFNDYINTENTTNMATLFYNCTSLTELDVSKFNTSKVTTMSSMFQNCSSIKSLDLSNFDMSNVTGIVGYNGDWDSIFSNCSSLEALNVSNWNVSKISDFRCVFKGCTSLRSLDLSGWNTSSANNMRRMFYNCSNLTNVDFGNNFNTSKVTNMGYMFYNCKKLTSLDLGNFNTSNVTNMGYMFYNCSSMASINLSSFNTSKVTAMYGMFQDCSSIKSLDLSNFDMSNVTGIVGSNGDWDSIFSNCSSLEALNVSNWNVSKISDFRCVFKGCTSLRSLDLSGWNTSSATNMGRMFYNCSNLTNVEFGNNFNTSNVTNMTNMFYNCSLLNNLDIRNFDFTNVTSYADIFYNVPSSSLITVKDQTAKDWVLDKRSDFTNVKTLEEL